MKIKNYVCKCGCDDFFFIEKGTHVGIYCIKCGKWFKWASHDERNLIQLKDGDHYENDRLISLNAALDVLHGYFDGMLETDTVCPKDLYNEIEALPSALTADDIETIRIHLSAFKEELCNQGRWAEAAEYERLIQRLTGKGDRNDRRIGEMPVLRQ